MRSDFNKKKNPNKEKLDNPQASGKHSSNIPKHQQKSEYSLFL